MSLLSRLFGAGGGKSAPDPEPEHYQGFAIYPDPIREGDQWRLGARIVRDVDGETRTHRLIRADLLPSEDAAAAASLRKAKQMIDEQGVRLFD